FDDLEFEDDEQPGLDEVAERLVSDSPFGNDRGLLGEQADRRQEEGAVEDEETLPQVFFFPSGETTPITFTIRSRDDIDLEIRRELSALGRVRDPEQEQEEPLTA